LLKKGDFWLFLVKKWLFLAIFGVKRVKKGYFWAKIGVFFGGQKSSTGY
jgi:hypothetical protein